MSELPPFLTIDWAFSGPLVAVFLFPAEPDLGTTGVGFFFATAPEVLGFGFLLAFAKHFFYWQKNFLSSLRLYSSCTSYKQN